MRVARRAAILAAMTIVPLPAAAHGLGAELTTPGVLSPWDLLAVAMLAALGSLYARGAWRLATRGVPQPLYETGAFGLGWCTLLVCLLPPLDGAALERFSAHMAQHELMMLVAVPLMVMGRPLPVWLWGMAPHLRPRAARMFQGGAVAVWRLLTAPLVAWILHGVAIWVWHAPLLYEWAIRNETVHAAQHLMFVGTSVLFWWGLLYGSYGRAGYGAAVFYVFTTVVHTGLLGALLTFAPSPVYHLYEGRAAAHGFDALGDQQVAGLLMWVPAGVVLTLTGLALFAAWLGESERRADAVPIADDAG